MTNINDFKKIEPPKFMVNGVELNEYEVRYLMLEIAMKKKDFKKYSIIDVNGEAVKFREDGRITGDIFNFSLAAQLSLDTIFCWNGDEFKGGVNLDKYEF